MKQSANAGMGTKATVGGKKQTNFPIHMKSKYLFECFKADGSLRWSTEIENIVVNAGLDDLLDKYFKGSGYTAAHYIGLKAAGTASAADVSSAHASWEEITAYSQAARPTYTTGAVSGQSVDNSASKAVFDITTATSVAGAFLIDNSTKGGTVGVLYGAADFAAARSVQDGDTLNVTVTCTTSAA